MKKNVKLVLITLMILLFGSSVYFSPYIAAYHMKIAAYNKDTHALFHYVDYPLLKESIKEYLNKKITCKAVKNKGKNSCHAFKSSSFAVNGNPMVDIFVTPEYLAMLVNGKNPVFEVTKKNEKAVSIPEKSNTETLMAYDGFNRFVVKVKEKGSSEDPVELIFKRYGFVSWKLSALHLP